MINSNGQIFHIDYGYIMENPIGFFNTPEIKVTNDIIDLNYEFEFLASIFMTGLLNILQHKPEYLSAPN